MSTTTVLITPTGTPEGDASAARREAAAYGFTPDPSRPVRMVTAALADVPILPNGAAIGDPDPSDPAAYSTDPRALDMLADADTVEAAGLDSSGRTGRGTAYTWRDVHVAHLSAHLSALAVEAGRMLHTWEESGLPGDALAGDAYPFDLSLDEMVERLMGAAWRAHPDYAPDTDPRDWHLAVRGDA